MKTCPHCGEELRPIRVGVRMTPLKARIFDVIKRAGAGGIDRTDLFELLQDRWKSRETMKSHIWQINELLEDTGYRIGAGSGNHNYRLTHHEPVSS